MLSESLLMVGIGLISYAFYKWATLRNDYFVKRNLPFRKPAFLFGSITGLYSAKYTAPGFTQMVYNWFPNDKLFGVFTFRKPVLVVRDPDLLKQLAVKDSDHFEDHSALGDEDTEDLFTNGLFFMSGQRWRDMRNTLSPVFTGSKLRQMFELVTECADDMTKHLIKLSAGGGKIEIEIKDLFSRYTNDVIATCAFGIRVNSFENPENEFIVHGKKSQDISGTLSILKMVFIKVFPLIARTLNLQILSTTVSNFFTSMVIGTMVERKKRGIIRPDLINLLMQVRQGNFTEKQTTERSTNDGFAAVEESDIGRITLNRHWKDVELVSQVIWVNLIS